MKNANVFIIIFILTLGFSLFPLPQNKEEPKQDAIVEEVNVVNVLVPVRVFDKGKPVQGLKKEDFQLYEDGDLQKINTFQSFSRQINKHASDIEAIRGIKPAPRFFVLIFNVFDYNDDVDKGINAFFENVYRESDKVVILTPERTFNINNSREMLESRPILKNMLKLYSKKARIELDRVFKLLDQEVQQFFETYFVDVAAKAFMTNYQRLWKEFSRKYLVPDVNRFYWFADVLKKVNMEKWVIVFQQREVFPQFKARSRIKQRIKDFITGNPTFPTTPLLQQMLIRLDYVFKMSQNVPLDKLQDAFFRANATFHVLMFRTQKATMSQDFEYAEAVSDYENSFRAISRATGGDVILTNKLAQSLKRVSQQKDYYYILSYSPQNAHNKNRKIKIKVNEKEGRGAMAAYYIKNLKLNPEVKQENEKIKIQVADFSFKNRQLNFTLVHYLRKIIEKKNIGVIEARIMLMDAENEKIVFNKSRILEAVKDTTKLNIRFNTLKKGTYHLILDLNDKLANTSCLFAEKVEI
jgi:hypothetical protein